MLSDYWGPPQGARDPLSTGYLGLVCDATGVELPPPLLGRPE